MKILNIKASFACIGKYVEQCPYEHKQIIKSGHELINHNYSHPNHDSLNRLNQFHQLCDKEIEFEIIMAQNAIYNITGYKCIGFRSPHFGGLHTEKVYPILKRLDYKYSSSTIASKTRSLGGIYFENDILEIPLSSSPDYFNTCLETWGIKRSGNSKHKKIYYKNTNSFLDNFNRLINWGMKYNSMLNFYFDPIDLYVFPEIFNHILLKLSSLSNNCVRIGSYKEVLKNEKNIIYSK